MGKKRNPAGTWRSVKTSARAAGGRLRNTKTSASGLIVPTSRVIGGKVMSVKGVTHKVRSGSFSTAKKDDLAAFASEAAARYSAMTGADQSLDKRRERARRHVQDLPVSKKSW